MNTAGRPASPLRNWPLVVVAIWWALPLTLLVLALAAGLTQSVCALLIDLVGIVLDTSAASSVGCALAVSGWLAVVASTGPAACVGVLALSKRASFAVRMAIAVVGPPLVTLGVVLLTG